MHYIIQENLFKEEHYELLFESLNRLGLSYTVVRIFPYVNKIVNIKDIDVSGSYNVDDLPDFVPSSNEKIFVFGAIKLAKIVSEKKWNPGSMMNSNHDYIVYKDFYKENLLNYDSIIHKIGDKFSWKENEIKFIRPTKDTKSFTGKVFSETEWNDTIELYLHNYRSSSFNEDTEIQVALPKIIYKEIRFWVVDGKIVTGSQYKLGSRVIYDNSYEIEAQDFAQSMVNKFQLAQAFVIDVCLTNYGWKIVECGCINACGFYKSDIQKMIIALEEKFGNGHKIISKEEIRKKTNSSFDGNLYIDFNSDEIQEFLLNLGYEIMFYDNVASVRDTIHDGGEINYIGNYYDRKFTTLIAVKENKNEILSSRLDSEIVGKARLDSVFKLEMKNKLLNLSKI